MPTDHILSLLIEERNKIDRAIAALQGTPRAASQRKRNTPAIDAEPTRDHKPKRRLWTAAMRLAARRRAKAAWAKRQKEAARKG
jgi:hypothetical protein